MVTRKIFSKKNLLIILLLLLPAISNASFIEATIGTAVVNDATATYFNPAALTLLKNKQLIGLGTIAELHTQFIGQATQVRTGFTQSGSSYKDTRYYLPSAYLAIPATKNIFLGVAVISNLINGDVEQNSILRYAQTSNSVRDIDFVPAIGIKLNDCFSIGAGLNFSRANFLLKATTGFPDLDIPDIQSHNEASGNSVGSDFGFLLKPTSSMLIGFNYRSALTYHLTGKSVFESNPPVISDHYAFNFWTPARYVLTISQSVNKKLNFISTIQWVKWNIFNTVHLHGIATQINSQPIIIPDADAPFHLHNSWIFTLGDQYQVCSKWKIRAAGSYLQSPGNGRTRISNGDNLIVGASTSYDLLKNIVIDASYAHAFIKDQAINIANQNNLIQGINKGFRDSVSLKLTFNF